MIHIKKRSRIAFLLALIVAFSLFIFIKISNQKNVSQNDVEFNVLEINELFNQYIDNMNSSDKDSDKLYKEIIFDNINQNFIEGSAYAQLAIGYIDITINDIADLKKKLELLKSNNVDDMVISALKNCNESLKGINTTVLIFPSTTEYEPLTTLLGGVSACTVGSGKILVLIDPTINGWEENLLYTIAHEYHHSVWTSKNVLIEQFTLLDYLIFEGKADSFANIIYPEIKVPWTSGIDQDEVVKIWNSIGDKLNSDDYELQKKVMFGGVDNYPFWNGYTIGYNIVQSFIDNNPRISIEEWTVLPPALLLEKSDY